jgi:3-deoxy-D-manno-octulosonic-acid transferase
MGRFYTFLLVLLAPVVLVRLWWRGRQSPGYRERWRERLGDLAPHATGPVIWVHAVSVGEAQAAQPLVRRLLAEYPDHQVLVTTTTPTGADRVRRLFDGEVVHRYFPYDLPAIVRRYLDAVQPRLLVVMETEIWPNLLRACAERRIPVMLANARMSARSARGYRWLGRLTAESLRRISTIAAQAAEDAARFTELGAPADRLLVTGSLKFDIRLPASVREQAEVLRLAWGMDRPVWVAASTHDGEEKQLLDAHARVLETFPGALLVLVPRHPERFESVAELVRGQGFRIRRRSRQTASPDCQVFLGDTMGELPVFYAAADVAFVGGSLVETGGHNLLEPAALGVPVIFGPNMFNFAAIAELFLREGAARRADDAPAVAANIRELFADPGLRVRIGAAGQRVVEGNRGALDRTMGAITALLDNPARP